MQPTQSCFSLQIGAKVEIAGADAAGCCSALRPPSTSRRCHALAALPKKEGTSRMRYPGVRPFHISVRG